MDDDSELDGLYAIVTLSTPPQIGPLVPMEEEVRGFLITGDDACLVIAPGTVDEDPDEITARFIIPWHRIQKVYADKPSEIVKRPALLAR